MPAHVCRPVTILSDLGNIRRVVDSHNQSPSEPRAFGPGQRGLEKFYLSLAKVRISAILRRNDPRILEAIAVKTEDSNEWRLQRKVYAGFDLRGADEPASLRSTMRRLFCGAEISKKRLQAWG
jgi:hypothetical protein